MRNTSHSVGNKSLNKSATGKDGSKRRVLVSGEAKPRHPSLARGWVSLPIRGRWTRDVNVFQGLENLFNGWDLRISFLAFFFLEARVEVLARMRAKETLPRFRGEPWRKKLSEARVRHSENKPPFGCWALVSPQKLEIINLIRWWLT